MEKVSTEKSYSLQLKKTIRATKEKVFDAWTQPEELARWFAPSTEFTTTIHSLNLQPGGQYRVEMKHSNGKTHTVRGIYREIKRPEKLVFTWAWEGKDPEMRDTVVTIEFQDIKGGTEVILTHELFPTPELSGEHTQGWNGCLDRLTTAVE